MKSVEAEGTSPDCAQMSSSSLLGDAEGPGPCEDSELCPTSGGGPGRLLCCCDLGVRPQPSRELLVPLPRHCRICLMSSEDLALPDKDGAPDNLILCPCSCKGTFVHEGCLRTWLSSRLSDVPHDHCELCLSPFLVERRFRPLRELTFTVSSRSDCVLHVVSCFLFLILVAGTCITFWCFRSGPVRSQLDVFASDKKLSFHEVLTLIVGTVSFVAFFVLLLTQMCVSENIFKLLVRWRRENQEERFVDRWPALVL